MSNMMKKLRLFLTDESGTETVEWAIVAGLLIAGAALVFTNIGDRVEQLIGQVLTELGG